MALVTGAARRVGRAIAWELASRGALVAVHYRRSRTDAEDLAARVVERGGLARAYAADLADRAQIDGMVDAVERDLGLVDVLVHNASLYIETPFPDASDSDVDRMIDVHMRAPLWLARRIGPGMMERGAGKIVHLLDVLRPRRGYLAYQATKAGLAMLTRGLAIELAPAVQVNAVAPGIVLMPEGSDAAERDAELGQVPLGRVGSPEDVARAVGFLVREDFITGEVLHVDGGRSAV